MTLAEEAQRYLAVVQAIREECDTDFLRFGGSNDTKREIRARLEAYDARRSAFDARAHWLGQT